MGMAGFIWMRQRKAPWEGYPLHPSTFSFLGLFYFGHVILAGRFPLYADFRIERIRLQYRQYGTYCGGTRRHVVG